MITITQGIAASFLLLLPAGLTAQDLKYTESTKVETAIRMPGMKDEPEVTTTFISKGRIRSDDPDHSTITDFAGGTFTQIDHASKTFWTMSFADMMAATQAMMAQAEGQMKQARAEAEKAREPMPQSGGKAEFDLTVEQLGDGPRVAGYSTRRSLLVLTAKFTSDVADPATGEPSEATLVFAADVCSSAEFPAEQARLDAMKMAAADPAIEKQAEAMTQSAKEMVAMPGMEGMTDGMARLAEELEKIEGTALKTLSYVMTLGPGVEFDREAILGLADKPLPALDLGAATRDAAKQGAKDALKDAVGLGGLLGRKKDPAPAAQPQAPKTQVIQMRTTTIVESASREPLPDDVFRAPANYKEKKPDFMKSSGG